MADRGYSMFGGCSRCHTQWDTRDGFLKDREVQIVALKPDLSGRDESRFIFHHVKPGCGADIEVPVALFDDLRQEPRVTELMFQSANCPGYCREVPNLKVCSVICRNASDRLLGVMLRRILAGEPFRPSTGWLGGLSPP